MIDHCNRSEIHNSVIRSPFLGQCSTLAAKIVAFEGLILYFVRLDLHFKTAATMSSKSFGDNFVVQLGFGHRGRAL